MKDFRDLRVWEKAHSTVLDIYRETRSFPRDEQFGLTSQLRRAAVSIPSNIAEGCGRGSDTDFARFLQNSMGSASEVEYQLLLSHDLDYLQQNAYRQLNDEVVQIKKMLSSFMQTLRKP